MKPEPTKADKLAYLYEKIGFPFSLCTTLNHIWQHTDTGEVEKNELAIVHAWNYEEECLARNRRNSIKRLKLKQLENEC